MRRAGHTAVALMDTVTETGGQRSQKRDRVRTSDVYEKSGYQCPVWSENRCLKILGMWIRDCVEIKGGEMSLML